MKKMKTYSYPDLVNFWKKDVIESGIYRTEIISTYQKGERIRTYSTEKGDQQFDVVHSSQSVKLSAPLPLFVC